MTTGALIRQSASALTRSTVDVNALVRNPLTPTVTEWPRRYSDGGIIPVFISPDDCDTGVPIPEPENLFGAEGDVTPIVLQYLAIQYAPNQIPQGTEWDLYTAGVVTSAGCAKTIDAGLWFAGEANRWNLYSRGALQEGFYSIRASYGFDIGESPDVSVTQGDLFFVRFRGVQPTDPIGVSELLPPTPTGATITPIGSFDVAVQWDTTGQPLGDYDFHMRLTSLPWNGYTYIENQQWTVTVESPAGVPPTITPIADAVGSVALIAYTENVTLDAGDLPITAWELTQKPTGAVQDPTITDNGDGTATVQWILAAGDIGGPYPFTVQATNAAGSDTESWNVTVEE